MERRRARFVQAHAEDPRRQGGQVDRRRVEIPRHDPATERTVVCDGLCGKLDLVELIFP